MEREIKLSFDSPATARMAVLAAGATPHRSRRLQDDAIYDTADLALAARGCTVRIRSEDADTVLTFKGPVQAGAMKVREEIETGVDDGGALRRVFSELDLRICFRYQKYREEFLAGDAVIAIDETPVGTFVEIEGSEAAILALTAALGRTPDDFVLASYRGLFLERRQAWGIHGDHMVFEAR